MVWLRKLTWALVVLPSLVAAGGQQRSPAVQAEVKQGLEALERGDFGAAEQHLSHALTVDPSLAEVRANLGLACYVDHKYSKAVEEFQQALTQNASLTTAQTFLPLSLAALDRCDEAVAGLRREFSGNPDVKLRRILGLSLQRCLFRGDRQAEADQVTQQLLSQYPDDLDVLYEAAQMYGQLSSQIYLRLMKVAPHSARGYQVMGQVSASEGNWQRAIDAYRQAISRDPTLPGPHLALAIQLLTHSPDPEAWKQALEELNAELKINPTSAEAEYEIGEIYRKHNNADQAVAAFRRAIELRPSLVEGRLGLAKVLRQQGHKEEALAVLEPALRSEPENAAVHFLLAQFYRDLGRAADAQTEEAILKRLQASP